MHNLKKRLQKANILIEKIQNSYVYEGNVIRNDIDKLLEISQEADYLYGQAIAHIYLAQYFQMNQEKNLHLYHLEKAKEIAEEKNFFDIKIEYFKQEGINNIILSDEISAINCFLKGLEISLEIKDHKSSAVFYNNIAEVFYESGAWQDAENYYTKALKVMHEEGMEKDRIYKKIILINMLQVACIQRDEQKAVQIKEMCEKIVSDDNISTMFFIQGEARLLLLQNKQAEATDKIKMLIELLKQSKNEIAFLQEIYLYLMEITLQLKQKDYAQWCIDKLETMYLRTSKNVKAKIEKFRIEFAVAFNCEKDEIYEKFFSYTIENEKSEKIYMAENFKSLLALYNAEKERNAALKEKDNLQIIADKDELTMLYNRRYYDKIISKFLRDDRVDSIAHIMIDVDFFKEYNECYGHQKGDEALQEVAQSLQENIPSEDAYAIRYGGDEFACVIINKTQEQVVEFVKNILNDIKEKNISHVKSRITNVLTISIGIYIETDVKNSDELTLIKQSDQALYRAKGKGRNTYSL